MTLEDLTVKLGFHVEASPLEHVEHKLDGIKERLEFLGAVEVLKGIYELAERFSGFGEQLETAAVSAGVTTDALQKLSFAAAQNAVSQDSLGQSLGHLSRVLVEAKDGSKEAVAQFAKAGIGAAQIAGFRNSTDALKALADAFAATDDPIQKQALAMQLLGRGSVNMVKFLNQGSGAIGALEDKAESVGAVLSEDSVASLAKFEGQMVSFGQTVKVLAATLASYVAPAIRLVVEHIQSFLAAHHAFVQTTLRKWAGDFAYALGFVTGLVEDAVHWILAFANAHPLLVRRVAELVGVALGLSVFASVGLKIISVMRTLFGGVDTLTGLFKLLGPAGKLSFKTIIGAVKLTRFMLGGVIRAVAALTAIGFPYLATAIDKVGIAIMAMPLGWAIASLAAIVLGGQALWAMFHGKSFRETWLGEMIAQILDLPEKLKGIYHWFTRGENDAKPLSPTGWSPWMTNKAGTQAAIEKDHAKDVEGGKSDWVGALMTKLHIAQNRTVGAESMQEQAKQISLNPSLSMDGSIPTNTSPKMLSMNVNAPVTINVPPGLSPDRAAQAVTDGVQAHLDRANGDAMRSITTAQVH